MIVDYRTGAGGLVAWQHVIQSPPDGYTLLLPASGLGAIKSLRPKTTIDPWRDSTWVSQVTNYQLIHLVHPSVPPRTLPREDGTKIDNIVRTANIRLE